MERVDFTKEELKICFLFAQGMKIADVAEAMNFSPKAITLKTKEIVQRLGARNKIDAICRIAKAGLLEEFYND